MRLIRVLSAATMLAAGLLTVPAASPRPAAAIGPLPECRLEDHLTSPLGYDDWATTLVDWNLSVGKDYAPPDLVSVRTGDVAGGGNVRRVVITDLKAMAAAAKKNGTPLVAWSPYRSYSQQEKLFNGYVKGYGYDSAINFSARPGHSEHQLGLTIDFVAVGDDGLTSNWEVTKTGAWMAKNAWKYGWLMSYPKGKQEVVCYSYEPWHYRYVGVELAKKIHDSGLTPREYLWANFTQLDTTFQPVPTPTPEATPTPSPSPTPVPLIPSAIASGAGSTGAPAASPPPTSPAGSWLGFDPAVVLAGIVMVLASIGLVVAVRRARASPGLYSRP
ncbi:MAG: M15 family metallopeptidase [Candidatus Limnocylindrales bacterium]